MNSFNLSLCQLQLVMDKIKQDGGNVDYLRFEVEFSDYEGESYVKIDWFNKGHLHHAFLDQSKSEEVQYYNGYNHKVYNLPMSNSVHFLSSL